MILTQKTRVQVPDAEVFPAMQREELIKALAVRLCKGKGQSYTVPSLLYRDPHDLGLSETQARDVYAALADVYAPMPYAGDSEVRHPVKLLSGIKEVDKAFGPLEGFVEVKGSAFTCGLSLLARYSEAAHKAGSSTLFVSPSRAKVSYFEELSASWSSTVSCAVATALPEVLHLLLQVHRGSLRGGLVLLDGLSILALGCRGVPTEGRDDYLLTLLEQIKTLATGHTVIVRLTQALLTTGSENRALGLASWAEQAHRSLVLKPLAVHRYLLEEVTDRLTVAHFDLS